MSRAAGVRSHRGKFQARWYDPSGQRLSRTFTRERDAKAFLSAQNVARTAEREGTAPKIPTGLLRDLAPLWLDTRPPVRRVDDESHLRNHILPAVGHLRLTEIDGATVQRFVRRLEATRTRRPGERNKAGRTLAATTIRGNLATLRKLLRDHGVGHGLDLSYKVQLGEHEWIRSKEDVVRVLEACRVVAPWFEVAMGLAVYAGFRKGEVAGLRIDALDFDRSMIRVDRSYGGPTKGRKARFVPLAPELDELLREWLWHGGKVGGLKRRAGDLVVVTPRGPVTARTEMAGLARRACKLAGLEDSINFHGGRHTCGSHLSEVASLSIVGAVLGHASPSTTARYSHLSTEHVARDERLQLSFGTGKPAAEVIPLRPADAQN